MNAYTAKRTPTVWDTWMLLRYGARRNPATVISKTELRAREIKTNVG